MNMRKHPLIVPPTLVDVRLWAEAKGLAERDALAQLLELRERSIAEMKQDPLRYGWEPSIWWVVDALRDWPYCKGWVAERIKTRLGMTWDTFKVEMRRFLGFVKPVNLVAVFGANRAGKTQHEADRSLQMAVNKADAMIVATHFSETRSVEDQQPLYYGYLPPEYRRQVASEQTYIKYKRKTGFSGHSFILPNGSMGTFRFYKQDRDTALEGLNADAIHMDEQVPVDWLQTISYRLATKGGVGMLAYTPVNGYTPTVGFFMDGAEAVKTSPGFGVPLDGGPPRWDLALGLNPEEFEQLKRSAAKKEINRVPYSRPEDCLEWLEGGTGLPAVPEDRRFEPVPRVMRCQNENHAIVMFHSCDNPFGTPMNVMKEAAPRGRKEVKIRVYGIAERTGSMVFGRFDERAHVLEDESVPQTGTNYVIMDPAGGRNYCMLWARCRREEKVIYREWPGSYEIPLVGVPGAWAVPSGRKNGDNDGDAGEGQRSFGFGLLRYKFEFARLERWRVFDEWLIANGGQILPVDEAGRQQQGTTAGVPGPDARRTVAVLPRNSRGGWVVPLDEELMDWPDDGDALEPVEIRYVDPRAAQSPRVALGRPRTLMDDLLEAGLNVAVARTGMDQGITAIQTALDFERGEEGSFLNRPHLFIAKSCRNIRFCVSNWRNVDGQKGAMKDFVDLMRYLYTSECEYVDAARTVRRGVATGLGNGRRPMAPPETAREEAIRQARRSARRGRTGVR